MSTPTNLFGLSAAEIADAIAPFGARPYAGRQIAAHLYARRVRGFDGMTDLSMDLRARLSSEFTIGYPETVESVRSADGTVRYVLGMPAGGQVESVFIPARNRVTLCISSQEGCALGCTFCMTATLGLRRHLSAGEIAGQVALLMEIHSLEPNRFNIVLMGMGEPLHNYAPVMAALGLLCDSPAGFGISPRHITISTVGLATAIETLAGEDLAPRLAVSLNATTDEVRSTIMPVNRTWPIPRLMEACRLFARKPGRRLTLEYVMLRGVNDTDDDMRRLASLALPLPARVNLIQFNSTPELPFEGTPPERVHAIRDGLARRGVLASVRESRGRDVRAACGQLAFGQRGAESSARPEARA